MEQAHAQKFSPRSLANMIIMLPDVVRVGRLAGHVITFRHILQVLSKTENRTWTRQDLFVILFMTQQVTHLDGKIMIGHI